MCESPILSATGLVQGFREERNSDAQVDLSNSRLDYSAHKRLSSLSSNLATVANVVILSSPVPMQPPKSSLPFSSHNSNIYELIRIPPQGGHARIRGASAPVYTAFAKKVHGNNLCYRSRGRIDNRR